jgi:site-specific DNA-methyltransferase (adenine-specific)
MEPKYISMIIPSRWFAGGKGLDAFRAEMLADDRISHIVDFHDASDCFPGVEIKGGVCYFLWNKNHHGECEVTPVVKGEKRAPMKRPLGENDVVIRFNESVSILKKVQRASEETFSKYVSSQTPFGLHTTFKFDENQASEGDIEIFGTKKQGWTARGNVKQNRQLIDKYKVLLSYAYNAGDGWPHQVINRPFVVSPPSCCTQTYVAIGPFDDAETAKNVEAYIKTKFFRFMVSLRKVAQHNPRDKFNYVPDLDMSIRWTDSSLYEKFELTKGEIAFVESMIREMP